jgi:hypothetical protein
MFLKILLSGCKKKLIQRRNNINFPNLVSYKQEQGYGSKLLSVFVHSNDISQLTGNENAMGIIETIKMLAWEEGMEIGEGRKSYEIVSRLLRSGKFKISEISDFACVAEDFVDKVKREMQA